MLWGLFFLIAVSAVIHRRKAAWFCVVLFLTTFTVHSLLAFKAKRYLLYALPCLFSLWALGGAGVLAWLRESSRSILPDDWPSEGVLRRVLDRLLSVVLLVGVLFALWVAPGPKLGREMLMGRTLGPLARENWSEASAVLKPLAERTGFVVSSSPPKALYYLGWHDLGLSVSQAAGRDEFAVERIMGRPVITRSDSLKRVMKEHPSGLIVIESAHWRVPRFVPDEVSQFILDHAQPIDLPGNTGVMAFTWGLNDADGLSGGIEEQQEP